MEEKCTAGLTSGARLKENRISKVASRRGNIILASSLPAQSLGPSPKGTKRLSLPVTSPSANRSPLSGMMDVLALVSA